MHAHTRLIAGLAFLLGVAFVAGCDRRNDPPNDNPPPSGQGKALAAIG